MLKCVLLTTHSFKDGVVVPVIGARNEARPSHQACTHVAHHVAIQVWHHHHVKLLRLRHKLGIEDAWLAFGQVRMCRCSAHLPTCMVVLSTIMLSKVMSG